MTMWRLRFDLSDDPLSRARLDEVLARRQVSAIELTPRAVTASDTDTNGETGTGTETGTDTETASDTGAGLCGDVLLELPPGDELGEVLAALHMISPRVFLTRVSQAAQPL